MVEEGSTASGCCRLRGVGVDPSGTNGPGERPVRGAARERRRGLAAAAALVAIVVLAACGGDGTPSASAPSGTDGEAAGAPGAAPTPVSIREMGVAAAPAVAGAAEGAARAIADPGLTIDRGTSWRDVVDARPPAEQACIHERLGDEAAALLAEPVLRDDSEEWEVQLFSCLAADAARALFLATVIASMAEEGIELGEGESACVRELVATLDVPAFLAATYEADARAFAEFVGAFWSCVPELLFESASEALGAEVGDLNESESACLREWLRELDPVALIDAADSGDDALLVQLSLGLLACAPTLLLADLIGDDAELGDEAERCLRELLGERGAADLADEDYLSLLVRLQQCVPTLDLGASPGVPTGDDDHADTPDGATALAVGGARRGELNSFNDSDLFAFEAERGVLYEINVELGTLDDSVLVLLDAGGGELGYNDDRAGSLASRLYWEAEYSGTHYVEVWGYGLGSYTVRVEAR